jgi:hypothetical protein
VTLCAKNLFGATSINPDWHKNAHDGFHHNKDGSASYSAFTHFLGHKDLGEKTMLFLIDGLYGNDNLDGPPHRKWKMAPFNDAWPNSIFMSLDSVAIDSVGFDFLTSEWPDLPDIANADNNRTAGNQNNKRSCRPAYLASMTPLESGVATFQSPSEQR